ncbi:hypothetical protein UlMin_005738 [Ulmus minor]
MGKKKFIDKKKSATFQLFARDSSDPCYDDSPGNDRVFVRVDNNPYSVDTFFGNDDADNVSDVGPHEDNPSIFADAPEDYDADGDDNHAFGKLSQSSVGQHLPDHVRREILELGFPDDGYNYLSHLREIKNTGGGSSFYENPKAKRESVPRDVKAFDASRLQISELNEDFNEKSIYGVASKTVGVRVQKVVDPEVVALLDDSDASRFGSDVEDLEEDFVVQANRLEDEADVDIDKRSILNDRFENKYVINKANTSEHLHNAADLNSEDGIRYHMTEANNESGVEKPRVRRLLDEKFDLLESQEYGTDDDEDDYGYIAEEEESLAAKLKNSVIDLDDFELDGNYRAPADLIHASEEPKSKELLDSARDIIHRCIDYAEKYEKDDQHEDVVIVQESSDESEVWDCETIVTTYSNLDNHPGKIGAPEVTRRKKLAETVSGALNSTNHLISLKGKDMLPVDFLPRGGKPAPEKVKPASLRTEQQKRKQHGQESKEEKKERKAAVKEERREARRVKKEMKGLYKGEAQRAQKVAATSAPSAIHLM